jgi:hypothetical protein
MERVVPVETALRVAQQYIRGFQKSETSEYLTGIQQIDRDPSLGHHAAPASRASFSREAC